MLALLFTLFFALSPSALISHTERAIVKVSYTDTDDNTYICTGFVVSATRGEVLTARHCVEPDRPVMVNGEIVTIERTDNVFALLQVESFTLPNGMHVVTPLTIASKRTPTGDVVWSFGYAYGYLTVIHRYAAGYIEKDIVLDSPLANGMSGGPMVNEAGEVVGVNQQSTPVLGRGCGIEEIRAFLKLR